MVGRAADENGKLAAGIARAAQDMARPYIRWFVYYLHWEIFRGGESIVFTAHEDIRLKRVTWRLVKTENRGRKSIQLSVAGGDTLAAFHYAF